MMTLDKDGTLEAVALTDGTLDKDGTLDAVALTDGTASITNGAISSVTTLTATTLTDGTASITGGKYTQRWRQQAGGYKLVLTIASIAVRHWIIEALRLPAGASGLRPGKGAWRLYCLL